MCAAVADLEVASKTFKGDAGVFCCLADAYLQWTSGMEAKALVRASDATAAHWRPQLLLGVCTACASP